MTYGFRVALKWYPFSNANNEEDQTLKRTGIDLLLVCLFACTTTIEPQSC